MPEYTLHRNHMLRTTAGCVNFEKNTPTWVPPHMEKAAVEIGAQPVEGEAPDPLAGEDDGPKAAVVGDERLSKLYGALELLVDENDSTKFTGQGVPMVKVVAELAGFEVDKAEVHEAWKSFMTMKADLAAN